MENSTSNQPEAPKIMSASKSLNNKGKSVPPITIAIAVLIIVGLVIALMQYSKISKLNTQIDQQNSKLDKRITELEAPIKYVQEQVEKDKFQAVFLNGGQVYFGHITHIDANTLTVENIFYLKTGSYQQGGAVTGDVSLVKLGDELHGPKDKMIIERKNVIFWENLKTDGQVAKAIKQYQSEHK